MSTQKGNDQRRNRPQKYKNRHAFKNDLYDKTPQIKFINSIQVSEVCQHCKEVIEWKIKYKKYKPLKQAKTCIKCSQRTIKKAYHVICSSCARELKCCAKCMKTASEKVQIEPPGPTRVQQMQMKSELNLMLKALSERKRRAFVRFMKKGKETAVGEDGENQDDKFVPHTKDELIDKIKLITLEEENEDDDEDDEDDDSYSDFDGLLSDEGESDDDGQNK